MSSHQTEQLRIGDAERECAAADLGEHFAQGRLSVDEHAERLEQVWAARTQADLAPVFRDLPGGAYGARPPGPAQPRTEQRWQRRRFPVPIFALVPVLVVLTLMLHAPFLVFGVLALWCLARGPWRRAHHGPHRR